MSIIFFLFVLPVFSDLVIRPDLRTLPRRYLWLMYHESITLSHVGRCRASRAAKNRIGERILAFVPGPPAFFFWSSTRTWKKVTAFVVHRKHEKFKISNEAKREYLEGFCTTTFLFWRKKIQQIFWPQNIRMIFVAKIAAPVAFYWVAVQELCEALMKLWRCWFVQQRAEDQHFFGSSLINSFCT